jgi:Holliday junction resolvase
VSQYRRGAAFEYRVRDFFEREGFIVIRSAGSHGPVDLACFRRGLCILIQCKISGGFGAQDINKMALARKQTGFVVLGARKGRRGLEFLSMVKIPWGWKLEEQPIDAYLK